ncbi:3160_t:CDS:2, partial [Entrophospora sp. SA101]
MLADMVVGNTVKLMLPVETKKQKTTEEETGVEMNIQSDGSDSRRRKEPKNNEGSKEAKKKALRKTPRKKRNTVQPPISNLIQPYSVVTDIKKQKADITFGQLFQAVPKLRSELSRSLRTPHTRRAKKTPQAEQLNAEIRSTAMHCKALGVKIPRKSSVVIINVNGQKTSPLGELDDLPLTIGGIIIPLSAI